MYWSFFSANAMIMHPVIMMRDPTTEVTLGPHLNFHHIKLVSFGLFIMYTPRVQERPGNGKELNIYPSKMSSTRASYMTWQVMAWKEIMSGAESMTRHGMSDATRRCTCQEEDLEETCRERLQRYPSSPQNSFCTKSSQVRKIDRGVPWCLPIVIAMVTGVVMQTTRK